MKLGANSLLFGSWDMETAFKYLKMSATMASKYPPSTR